MYALLCSFLVTLHRFGIFLKQWENGFGNNEDHSILFKTEVTVDQMVSVTMKTIPYYLKQK